MTEYKIVYFDDSIGLKHPSDKHGVIEHEIYLEKGNFVFDLNEGMAYIPIERFRDILNINKHYSKLAKETVDNTKIQTG